jgi:protein O-GlcNAc transferase
VLQVRGLITGTYTRQEQAITVQARFVELAGSERVEPGEVISNPGGAYLRAPQRIAAAAAERFQARVTAAEAERVRHVFGDSVPLELYARYAQARWAQARGTRVDHEHAIAVLTTLLEAAPSFAQAHLALGRSWLVLDDPWRAWSAFRAALALDARLPDAHKRVGDVLMALPTRQYEPALRAYEAALELAPDDVEAWVGLANVRQALGQIEAAIGDYEKALALDPANAASHVGLGNIYAAEKTLYYDAVAELRQAIALDPRLVVAHLALGDLYEEKGLYLEAAERYRSILSLDPRHPGATWGLAEALEKFDVPAAIDQWEQYLRLVATLPAEQDWADMAQKHVEKLRRGGAPAAR